MQLRQTERNVCTTVIADTPLLTKPSSKAPPHHWSPFSTQRLGFYISPECLLCDMRSFTTSRRLTQSYQTCEEEKETVGDLFRKDAFTIQDPI